MIANKKQCFEIKSESTALQVGFLLFIKTGIIKKWERRILLSDASQHAYTRCFSLLISHLYIPINHTHTTQPTDLYHTLPNEYKVNCNKSIILQS